MEKKRNKLEVIRDILAVIKARNGKIKPTHILYKSNLSYDMMSNYLKYLSDEGMIKEIQLKKGRTYEITIKGNEYLDKFSMIKNFTESFGLS